MNSPLGRDRCRASALGITRARPAVFCFVDDLAGHARRSCATFQLSAVLFTSAICRCDAMNARSARTVRDFGDHFARADAIAEDLPCAIARKSANTVQACGICQGRSHSPSLADDVRDGVHELDFAPMAGLLESAS